MENELFILILALVTMPVLFWGFRVLPGRGWQMLATLPVRKGKDCSNEGTNLTWYGLLTANAYAAALALLFVLLGSAAIPLTSMLVIAALLLLICVPASRLIARLVEGKSHTFTIGGAVFVGIVAAPWVIELVSRINGTSLPVLTFLAAVGCAYALGEGLGRIACISFGCCYGKPLANCGPRMQRLFGRWSLVFQDETRKACYADGLAGQPLIPIQMVTAVLYVVTGLIGVALFLNGLFAFSFILILLVTQLWRVFSEFLRADYRGKQGFSAYQIMGLLAIPYAVGCVFLFSLSISTTPLLLDGLQQFWQPVPILFLQIIWFIIFIYTGRSTVTGAHVDYYLHRERI
ncbi:prolipoprotein diacylglyceryl transferase family protein [Pelovirga terrestris]|uniref:Prolipoprotein diacylglyceryl transferase n=1 Tax=Pelovirga terrestris TaxID=2771352 RepID=A0A8J6QQ32_9BACT|nr:prolipoprotein diacylglyceryl transferase family protein [Pelovirga terrestris]MBD1400841.1 prolipoprotein diacylglyceryl transferase [Pelovirga terrestris]